MELYAALTDLARDHGTALFRDAAAFRGALDDYLDEGTASSGTINLLTDVVRLGALDGMLTMLDSGATPEAAVDSAGQRLARDRGSNDLRGCQWACAVLGYALGRVPEPLVSSLAPQGGTAAGAWSNPSGPTAPAPERPTGPPPGPNERPTAVAQPGSRPGSAPGSAQGGFPGSAPGVGSGAPAYPSGGTPYRAAYSSGGAPGWAPQQPKKRRTGLIVAIVAVVVLLVAGGVTAAVLVANSGGDDTSAKDSPSSGPTLDGPRLDGEGYTMTLPSDEWTDGTEELTSSSSDAAGTIDKVGLWGDSLKTARANVIVEASSAEGKSDPNDLESEWRNAIQGASEYATLTDLPDREVDGQQAIGVEMVRENGNGVQIHQEAYLVISGTSAYSIDYTFRASDSGAEDAFTEILDAWQWDD